MNEFSNEDRTAAQIEVDRFVDDELSDDERRRLLSSLDDRPDGWRALALAFVESQTLERELTEWAAPSSDAAGAAERAAMPASSVSGTSPATNPKVSGVVFALATAASFLVAFGVAILWRGSLSPMAAGDPQAATNARGSNTAGKVETSASSLVVDQPAIDNTVNEELVSGPPPAGEYQTAQDEGQRPIEVPVMAVNTSGEHWQQNVDSALPRHVVESLQRSGYRIDSHKNFHTIRLDDGRRVVIPIEHVDVQFIGPETHQ